MSLTAIERETVITFSDDSEYCEVWTCQQRTKTKLNKLVASNPESYELVESFENGNTYRFPFSLISYRKPRAKRELSKEDKKKLSDRLQKARKGQA